MKLSIVTVNRNNAVGLEKTLESVFSPSQPFADFEEIVVDGASVDGSRGVLEKFASKIGKCVSEPDRGIYDAMNKGARMASGDYLLFLNSGDVLLPHALEGIPWEAHADFLCGRSSRVEQGRRHRFVPFNGEEPTFGGLYYYPISHQAVFTRRELLLKFGGYDGDRYPICADWARSLDFWLAGASFLPLDMEISEMEPDGVSSARTPEHQAQRDEKARELLGPLLLRRIQTGDKFVTLLPGMNRFLLDSPRCARAFQVWNRIFFAVVRLASRQFQ